MGDPYCRGINGADYGPYKEELEQILWDRLDREAEKELIMMENALKDPGQERKPYPDNMFYHQASGRWIDTNPVVFHGYTVCYDGRILGKKFNELKFQKRERRGGGFDWVVLLNYNNKVKKWTVSRLIGACFLGNIEGMEMNHIDRNPSNVHCNNLEISTRSENQKHWRKSESLIQ